MLGFLGEEHRLCDKAFFRTFVLSHYGALLAGLLRTGLCQREMPPMGRRGLRASHAKLGGLLVTERAPKTSLFSSQRAVTEEFSRLMMLKCQPRG